MSKKRGIKCSWCLDESPTVYRKLWYSKPDRVTKKTENFGEMLVECYDLDPDQWSKSQMRDAVICYVCICSLRIAFNEKQEALAAAYYKSIKDTTNKPQKQRPKASPDNGDLESKVDSKPLKSKAPTTTSKPQKPNKSTVPHKVDLESKIDSKPLKSKAPTATSKPQKPIKSTAPHKVDLESKIDSKTQKSKIPTSERQKPIKSKASVRVDLESRRKRADPKSQKSKTPVDINLEEENLEASEEEYLEEMGVEELKSGTETFFEEEYSEYLQPPKEIISLERVIPGNSVTTISPSVIKDEVLKENYLEQIKPHKEMVLENNSEMTKEEFNEEYLEETNPDIDKMELHYQYEFLDNLPDESDSDKTECVFDTEFLSTKPSKNVKMETTTRKNIPEVKKSIKTEDLLTVLRYSKIKNMFPERKTKDTIVRKSKRKVKLTAAAMEYKKELKSKRHILDHYTADEMAIFKMEDKVKTESESKENCGYFDKVYLEDTNEEMYVSENWKMQNYVRGRSRGGGDRRGRPKIIIRNRALFNELIHKLNNKQLKMKEAAEKMGLTHSTMRTLATKHPKYIPRQRKELPTPARLNEIVEKLNKNQLSLNGAAVKMGFSYTKLKSLVTKHPKYIPKSKMRRKVQWSPEQLSNVMDVLTAIDNNQIRPTQAARTLGISMDSVRRLRIRYTGYDPSSSERKYRGPCKESIAHTISRIKAEFPEEELRSMMTAIRQKKLMMKVARKKLRCNPQVLHEILIEMCGSTGRGSNVTPEDLVNDIKSILTYTNATPFRLGPGRTLTCAYCYCLHVHLHGKHKAEIIDTPDELRDHTRIQHNAIRVVAVEHFTKLGQEILRVDITNLQCTVCPTRLPSWNDMFPHLETIHSVKLEAAKSGVIPYILDSQTKTNFTCALCPKQFLGISKLNQHMNTHATGNKCFVCNKTFMYNDLLRIHERRIHNNPERNEPALQKNFCCDQCGKVMRFEKSLKNHQAKMHEGQSIIKPKLFCCEFCGIAYSTHSACALHIHHVHEGMAKPFKVRCKVCLDRFPSKLKKIEHMRKVHNVKVSYTCDWCPRTFPIRGYLMKHLNKAHDQKTSLSYPTEL